MIKEVIAQLSNQELQNAYSELKEWMQSGVLRLDGYVRPVHKSCEERLGTDIDLRVIENQILYEIADRFSSLSFN